MIVLSNKTEQTIQPGEAIIFDDVILKSGYAEYYMSGSSSVRLRRTGIYELQFTGNIASFTSGDILELALQFNDDTLPETTMIQMPINTNSFSNVSASTIVRNCLDVSDYISVANIGSTPIIIAGNSCLFIKRVA